MIHSYADHYRFAQKNLFLGESLVWSMTPPAIPGAPGGPEGSAEGLGAGLDVQARKRVEDKKKITEFMKELVPEKAKVLPDDDIETREGWMELMGEYNGVQSQITTLLEYKKKFQNPEELKKDPNFRETYKKYYANLVQLRYLQSIDMGGVDWADLQRKADGEFTAKTADVIRDTEHMIAQLVGRRKVIWDCIEGRIHSDFSKRLENLKSVWSTNPPPGFEGSSADWLAYLANIEGQVNSHHFEDTDNAEQPKGAEYFEELRALWSSIADSESTVEMWQNGQNHHITIPGLLADIDHLEEEKQGILTPDFLAKYEAAVDDVTGPLEKVIAEMKERGAEEAELKELEETLKGLKESRDLDSQFDEMINSTEPSQQMVRAGTPFTLPKGLRKQVEFLKTFPANETESKHMLYRMQDAIKTARETLHDTEKYTTETLPNYLLKVKLMQEKLHEPAPRKRRELMILSGPKTFSILKHVVTSLFERSWERDTKRKAGIFGNAAFGFLENIDVLKKYDLLRPFSELSSEADTEREHAETEGFQHYEKVHEHLSVEHMIHKMQITDNEFEFRGLIGLLTKKGRMRWDDEAFFKQLNKFQKIIHVSQNLDRHMEDRVKSEEHIKEAIYAIYGDVDIYRDWLSKNSSALKSEKQNKSARYGELSEQRVGDKSALQAKIDDILQKYKGDLAAHKHFSDADPIEYEAIIDYAIDQGKLDNEDALYYMIQGIGCGHMGQPGLIPLERASELTGKNNNYPAIELFADKTKRGDRPTLADVQEWAQMSKEEYIHWYHSYVMYQPKVRQRLNKAQSQGVKMDHDYFTGTAAYLSATSMEGLLRANETGGYGLQVTAVQNGSVGMLFGLDVLAEEYNELGDKGKDGLSRMVDMITRFDGVLNGRMHRKESNYMRLDYTAKDKEYPRYVGAYKKYFGRGQMTTGQNLEKMKSYFRILDSYDSNFPLFARLFDSGFATDQDAMAFAEGMMVEHPGIFGDAPAPQGIDGLYQVIGAYVAHIAKEKPEVIQAMNAKIIAEHRSAGKSADAIKDSREANAQSFRNEYAAQIKTGRDDHGGHSGGHGHGAHGAHGEHGAHGAHGEHPTEGGGHGDHGGGGGGAHGDDHGAAGAAHGGAVRGSTHGGGNTGGTGH